MTRIHTTTPSRYRAYFEGDPKKYQGPVQDTGYPKTEKEIELNHKYCISPVESKGLDVDELNEARTRSYF